VKGEKASRLYSIVCLHAVGEFLIPAVELPGSRPLWVCLLCRCGTCRLGCPIRDGLAFDFCKAPNLSVGAVALSLASRSQGSRGGFLPVLGCPVGPAMPAWASPLAVRLSRLSRARFVVMGEGLVFVVVGYPVPGIRLVGLSCCYRAAVVVVVVVLLSWWSCCRRVVVMVFVLSSWLSCCSGGRGRGRGRGHAVVGRCYITATLPCPWPRRMVGHVVVGGGRGQLVGIQMKAEKEPRRKSRLIF